jgi:hypothetical protein
MVDAPFFVGEAGGGEVLTMSAFKGVTRAITSSIKEGETPQGIQRGDQVASLPVEIKLVHLGRDGIHSAEAVEEAL